MVYAVGGFLFGEWELVITKRVALSIVAFYLFFALMTSILFVCVEILNMLGIEPRPFMLAVFVGIPAMFISGAVCIDIGDRIGFMEWMK